MYIGPLVDEGPAHNIAVLADGNHLSIYGTDVQTASIGNTVVV
jgi:hypothetical protein